jgi:hypothetical protein
MLVTTNKLLNVERPVGIYGYIQQNYMIIISVVHISDNIIDTGTFPLGSKCMEAKKLSE